MDRYFRFEICFEGENQECGIFQALDETGISYERAKFYDRSFAEIIKIPVVTESCKFYFTEAGLLKSMPLLSNLLDEISIDGWTYEILFMETDIHPDAHSDEDQAAFRTKTLEGIPQKRHMIDDSSEMKALIESIMIKTPHRIN